MKNTITEMKNTRRNQQQNNFGRRMDMEYRIAEITATEYNKEKEMKQPKKHLEEHYMNQYSHYRCSKQRTERKDSEKIFEETKQLKNSLAWKRKQSPKSRKHRASGRQIQGGTYQDLSNQNDKN